MQFHKKILSLSSCFIAIVFASTIYAKPYEHDLDVKLLKGTTAELEKMLPTLERQVELIIKMVDNDRYRNLLEEEFAVVMVSFFQNGTGGNYDPEKCDKNCNGISTYKNKSEWERGNKLSFLAKVLDEYEAPLSKTCVGVFQKSKVTGGIGGVPNIYQPLNWNFPIAYLSGHMFAKEPTGKDLGFGVVDLTSLSAEDLTRMAKVTSEVIRLQVILRDGIEGKLDENKLQKFKTYEHAAKRYLNRYKSPFGTGEHKPYDEKPCEIFAGKGQAEHMWPVLGYEMILPKEIVENSAGFNWRKNDYTFGGGLLEADLAGMPTEYLDAWKNLANYFSDYFPEMKADLPIQMYEKLLEEKTNAPLGDLMSVEDGNDLPDFEDDGLELPSLE
jgi:hypothetical protein